MHELIVVALLTLFAVASAIGGLLLAQMRVPLLLVALLGFLGAAAQFHILLRGSVMLVDPAGRVATAELVTGGEARAMHRGPFGLFYGEPEGDGFVRLTCRGGRIVDFGYVTPGMPTYQRLTPPNAC